MILKDETGKEWTTRLCPACGADRCRLLFYKRGIPFVACDVCGSAYVSPAPIDSVIRGIYSGEWGDFSRDPEKLEMDFHPRRYWRELGIIPKPRRCGSLLDVGCANGAFLSIARRLGFSEIRGIDICPMAVEYANERLGAGIALYGDLLERPFAPASFDVVTLWATLEHLRDPGRFVEEAFRLSGQGVFFARASLAGAGSRCDGWGSSTVTWGSGI